MAISSAKRKNRASSEGVYTYSLDRKTKKRIDEIFGPGRTHDYADRAGGKK